MIATTRLDLSKKLIPTSKLWGWSFFGGTQQQLLKSWQEHLDRSSTTAYIVTPNPEQVIQAHQDPELGKFFSQADYVLPDGIGILWAARVLTGLVGEPPLAERLTGSDAGWELLKMARQQQLPVAIVGGRNLVIPPAWTNLHWLSSYQNIQQPQAYEEAELRTALERIKPAIVMVAFGAPWQEQWLQQHRQFLEKLEVKLAMVVGGAPDIWFGTVRRAPQWLRNLGLEWLWRLMLQPWRWRRQLRLLSFVGLVLRQWWQLKTSPTSSAS